MGVLRSCSSCGHRQMIGHNAVDGRLKWWTQCEKCPHGNFMAPIDPRQVGLLRRRVAAKSREQPAPALDEEYPDA